ncbi:MAG: signal peptidase I [Firmicutes bacterium]|nr:signal peptidase I [Bacillota bacterium]
MSLSPHRSPIAGRAPAEKSVIRELGETFLTAAALAIVILLFVARAFTVDGPSMQPTLQSGERLLIDKVSYYFREPTYGDIIVFRYPADPSQYYIKRVVGLPGDVIAIAQGMLFVNGQPIVEDYINGPTFGKFGPYTVPEGHYFVLGDNRNNSEDSRSPRVGPIPRELIVGRAAVRYWPLPRTGFIDSDGVAWASP